MAPKSKDSATGKNVMAAKKGTSTKVVKKKLSGEGRGKSSSIEDVENRILAKMADRHAFGITEVSKEEFLKFAGYSYPTARRFIDTTRSLTAKGYIEYNSSTKCYFLTALGLENAPASSGGGTKRETPKTNDAFHEQLKEQFESPKAFAILRMLADGRIHERLKFCNDLGYKYQTAQAFAKSLTELKTYGFLEPAGKGQFRLTDKAFPCGRPGEE